MRTLSLKLTQQEVIESFLSKVNAQKEETEHYKIITYDAEIKDSIFPALVCFLGKSAKAYCNYYYRTDERRREVIENFKRSVLINQQRKEERKRERREFKTTCKVDDIFVSSWGYEQTNVDYYKILEIKGNEAVFVEIGQIVEEGSEGHDCCRVLPDPGVITGEPFKKKIQLGECISMASYEHCHKWEGKSNYKSWYY